MTTLKLTAEQYAQALATVPIKTFANMYDEDAVGGAATMLSDLQRLAKEDGCVAAAVALEIVMWLAETLHDGGKVKESPEVPA